MAVANVALLLARRGHRVLVVDWDLEAPGIELYFADLKIEPDGLGLLALLREVTAGGRPDYWEFTWALSSLDGKFSLRLLHSGRETDPEYYDHFERFEWPGFFEAGGGRFLEDLRERWLSDFDFVLIDSRTGLSDSGGVCTIQLPEIVVAMFTPARQSLFGVRDVMRLAQAARQRLAYDRPNLSVVPLPSRVERKQASYSSWLKQFAEQTNEFFSDWLPRDADRAQALDRLALDHALGVLHGERIVVLTPDTENKTLAAAYERLARILASDLADLSGIVDDVPDNNVRLKTSSPSRLPHQPNAPRPERASLEYAYDIFVSYPRTELVTRWIVQHLLPQLTRSIELHLGRTPTIFIDQAELALGEEWVTQQRMALLQSRMLLGVWTASYFRSRACLAEFETFRRRGELTGGSRLVAALFHNGMRFPVEAQSYQSTDFREYAIAGDTLARSSLYVGFLHKVDQLAEEVVNMITSAPPLDSNWPVVEPKGVAAPPTVPSLKLI